MASISTLIKLKQHKGETMFNTYIEDEILIGAILSYDWIVMKNTWTNCPEHIYEEIKNEVKEILPDHDWIC
jgi:hypothetical protein|tara:strand:+ start:56 stop:268 length:213 start_codon:yes stop_codon:yes gene_type:complete